MKKNYLKKEYQKGFTLIEFIVIISIFAIMAAVALFNFNGFRSNVALNNLTHDIALTIRQAQVFGWSTQTVGLVTDVDGNNLQQKQGVYFKYDPGTQSYGQEFILYSKENPFNTFDGAFNEDPNSGDQIVDTIKIQGTSRIAAIYTARTRRELTELVPGTGLPIGGNPVSGSVSVAFARPRPEALFYDGANPLAGSEKQYLGIYVRGSNDANDTRVRVITVSQFGEINVQ